MCHNRWTLIERATSSYGCWYVTYHQPEAPKPLAVVAERAVCEPHGSPGQHRLATEVLAAVRAALPELEARATAEAEASALAAKDDGQW